MAWGATEIAELKERVARIAPDNVPRETATPRLFTQFAEKRGVQTPQQQSMAAPQANAEKPSQDADTLELAEEPLSNEALDAVIQTAQPKNAPKTDNAAQPIQLKPTSVSASGDALPNTKADENDEVGKVERDERALNGRLLELSRKADPGDLQDTHVGSGYRSRLVNGQENAKARAKKRGQQDIATSMTVMAMQQRIDDLYADINRWEQENEQYEAQIASWERDNARDLETIERNKRTMEENRRQIEDINQRIILLEQLRTMRDAGNLDPDNPEHADMLRQAGVDPEEYKKDTQALEAEIEEQEAKKEALETENQALESENDALIQSIEERNAAIDDARAKIDANKVRIKEAQAEIKALEKQMENDPDLSDEERNALRAQQGALVSERDSLVDENVGHKVDLGENAHEQVESFMKAIAALDKIEDPVERMEQEKRLVESLSPEAIETLEKTEGTKHLFEEDYFKPLESADMTAQETAPVAVRTPGLGG